MIASHTTCARPAHCPASPARPASLACWALTCSDACSRLTDLGTENVASKKYTAARWSFSACMMIWSRRSCVASGSAASSPAIRPAIFSSWPANPLGARPSVASPAGSRGSANAP